MEIRFSEKFSGAYHYLWKFTNIAATIPTAIPLIIPIHNSLIKHPNSVLVIKTAKNNKVPFFTKIYPITV